MANYMLIDLITNFVVDTIVLDDDSNYKPKDGFKTAPSDTAGIGWIYNADGSFTNPNADQS